jgi:hypothetical protein
MFRDREYSSGLASLALPITLQYLVSASLNLLGGLMIGQLGETAVAAVGLANQVTFLLTLMLFGISSGTAIFSAQLWGARDVANIRRVLGLSLTMAIAGATAFAAAAILFPSTVLSLYTHDPAVVALGSSYLRIMRGLPGYGSNSARIGSAQHRRRPHAPRRQPDRPEFEHRPAMCHFGHLGLPEWASTVRVGALLARILECGLLVWLTYRRRHPAAAPAEMPSYDCARSYGPVPGLAWIAGEMPVAGITIYNAVKARRHRGNRCRNISRHCREPGLVIFFGIRRHGHPLGNQICAEGAYAIGAGR